MPRGRAIDEQGRDALLDSGVLDRIATRCGPRCGTPMRCARGAAAGRLFHIGGSRRPRRCSTSSRSARRRACSTSARASAARAVVGRRHGCRGHRRGPDAGVRRQRADADARPASRACRFVSGSAHGLPCEDASVDVATMFHVGMNIADKPRSSARRRVLAPGGRSRSTTSCARPGRAAVSAALGGARDLVPGYARRLLGRGRVRQASSSRARAPPGGRGSRRSRPERRPRPARRWPTRFANSLVGAEGGHDRPVVMFLRRD